MIDVKGVVPFWGAVEEIEEDGDFRRLSISWFREDEPPYRQGRGLRIRLRGDRALHVGVMRHSRFYSHPEVLAQREGADDDIDDLEAELKKYRPIERAKPAPRSVP